MLIEEYLNSSSLINGILIIILYTISIVTTNVYFLFINKCKCSIILVLYIFYRSRSLFS